MLLQIIYAKTFLCCSDIGMSRNYKKCIFFQSTNITENCHNYFALRILNWWMEFSFTCKMENFVRAMFFGWIKLTCSANLKLNHIALTFYLCIKWFSKNHANSETHQRWHCSSIYIPFHYLIAFSSSQRS